MFCNGATASLPSGIMWDGYLFKYKHRDTYDLVMETKPLLYLTELTSCKCCPLAKMFLDHDKPRYHERPSVHNNAFGMHSLGSLDITGNTC